MNEITVNNAIAAMNAATPQYKPSAIPASTNNPIFPKDSVSLGNVDSSYQVYSPDSMAPEKNKWAVEYMGLAKVCLSDVFVSYSYVISNSVVFPGGPVIVTSTDFTRDADEAVAGVVRDLCFRAKDVAQLNQSEKMGLLALADSGAELTDDKKINTILAKYSEEPMDIKTFHSMINELRETGLFSSDVIDYMLKIAGTQYSVAAYKLADEENAVVYNYDNETGKHSIVDLVSLFFDEMEKHDSELIQMRDMNIERHEYERVNSFYKNHSLAPHRKTSRADTRHNEINAIHKCGIAEQNRAKTV